MAKMVFSGLVMLCRLAVCPTSTSPESVNATIDGVVRAPSAFSITLALLPSITATQELVVPRSMPIALVMMDLLFGQMLSRNDEDERRSPDLRNVLPGGRASGSTSAERRRVRRLP